MKFISWNVNGLRACIEKGFMQYFADAGADFFCLQETKLSAGQIKEAKIHSEIFGSDHCPVELILE